MNKKYETLINILDRICLESPEKYKRYYPNSNDIEGRNQARSRAIIHLYLKVIFGILDFEEREYYITDGPYDGGIDAYYIDIENKKIYFIQSKFRINATNYETKEISLNELLSMDVDRITEGFEEDENKNKYNGKIQQLIRDIKNIDNIGRYSYEIIVLANITRFSNNQIRRITGGFPATVFDFNKTYTELLFPVVTGTFYNQSELSIYLNLANTTSSSAKINYSVKTEYENCDITVVFVPTEEIGKILYKYKNSILKYNPRCYLELQSNDVNKEIYNTIIYKETNEFALYNNGLTMLSDETSFNEKIGQQDKAQICITSPQIINGGQTAFTLSRIYEEMLLDKQPKDIFKNKEVLLKIITFGKDNNADQDRKIKLIESISRATNQQSQVSEADRRSNEQVQLYIQKEFFDKFGIYYERKKGEYSDGLKEKYINRKQIISREHLLRLAMACNGNAAQARRNSDKKIFEEKNFSQNLTASEDNIYKYYYAYLCYQYLNQIEKQHGTDQANYGFGLRYGKYAIISAIIIKKYLDNNSLESYTEDTLSILNEWLNFEQKISSLSTNSFYFYPLTIKEDQKAELYYNFDGYYKGKTLNSDIKNYFTSKKQAVACIKP
ncbi:AIPR family protein [Neisseria zalophi]|nr:AIPR family protein [Neisseria zalophi]